MPFVTYKGIPMIEQRDFIDTAREEVNDEFADSLEQYLRENYYTWAEVEEECSSQKEEYDELMDDYMEEQDRIDKQNAIIKKLKVIMDNVNDVITGNIEMQNKIGVTPSYIKEIEELLKEIA